MHDDGYFDERVAASYDRPDGDEFDPALIETIGDFLVECAGAGRALELGIGTGRIAVPLVQRGVSVHGIDLSRAMVARLRRDIDEFDVAAQGLISHHFALVDGRLERHSIPMR